MGKIDDPKISKPIIREPEPAGTPIERREPNGKGQERSAQELRDERAESHSTSSKAAIRGSHQGEEG
jgi:hypothetical protein